jgi:hypothetical protein
MVTLWHSFPSLKVMTIFVIDLLSIHFLFETTCWIQEQKVFEKTFILRTCHINDHLILS